MRPPANLDLDREPLHAQHAHAHVHAHVHVHVHVHAHVHVHVAGVLGPSLAAGLTTGKDQSRSYSESSSIMMPYMCMSTMINLMPQKVSAQ